MTLRRWREHPAARDELSDAVRWYADRDLGLGERFADEARVGVTFIRAWPEVAPSFADGSRVPPIRRKSIDAFPYGIIYFLWGDEIVVIAYAHAKRRPGYWRKRLDDL